MLDELKRLVCLVFGHRMPPQGWWGDGLYGEIKGGYRDNCGRSHFTVRQTCPRCGDRWVTARFHGENPTIIACHRGEGDEMSKIGNHRVELQETDAYRWGWDWAKLGMELHHWLLPHLGTTQSEAALLGWQDYHNQERQP